MKYHSPFSTIIISIAVLLVFLTVAVLTVAALSMTSPTLILANELMDRLEASDSDLSISFGSIDRNLRDGVFISDLLIGYKGEEAASFGHITAHMGLFQLIRYALFGTGNLSIEASGGRISITEEMIGGDGGESVDVDADLGFLDKYSISGRYQMGDFTATRKKGFWSKEYGIAGYTSGSIVIQLMAEKEPALPLGSDKRKLVVASYKRVAIDAFEPVELLTFPLDGMSENYIPYDKPDDSGKLHLYGY